MVCSHLRRNIIPQQHAASRTIMVHSYSRTNTISGLRARRALSCSMMFHWEPEGHYHHRLCTATVTFLFSNEHLYSVLETPFWLSTDDTKVEKIHLNTATICANCLEVVTLKHSLMLWIWSFYEESSCLSSLFCLHLWSAFEMPFWLSTADTKVEKIQNTTTIYMQIV